MGFLVLLHIVRLLGTGSTNRSGLDQCGEGQSPEGDLDGGTHQGSNVIR
jgi:hypothetical protein